MKTLKNNLGWMACILILSVNLSACGSSSSSSATSGPGPLGGGAVSGVAMLGPIAGGTVNVYALSSNGSTGSLLGTAMTAADGSYSVSLNGYQGNVLIVITGGTYVDEATGTTKTNTTLNAAVPNASGNVSVAVTPLTQLAVQHAGTLISANVTNANALVSSLIGANILTTQPINALSATSATNATQAQIDYALMLAAISQYGNTSGKNPSSVISDLQTALTTGSLSGSMASQLNTALSTFIASSNNATGITSVNMTKVGALLSIGGGISPNSGKTSLDMAKAFITDTRNIGLSIYNYDPTTYSSSGPGIVVAPFQNLVTEINTSVVPDLTVAMNRAAWILGMAQPQISNTYTNPLTGEILTLNFGVTNNGSLTTDSANFILKNSGGTITLGTGSLTVSSDSLGYITSGQFSSTLATASGSLTASFNYTGTKTNNVLTNVTFQGALNATGSGVSVDFGTTSGLSMTLSPITWSQTPLLNVYPTSLNLSAQITTSTTKFNGVLDIPSIVWINNAVNVTTGYTNFGQPIQICTGRPIPTAVNYQGSIQALQNGTPILELDGAITGNFKNATMFNGCANQSATNFPAWSSTFNGNISAPKFQSLTSFFRVDETSYKNFSFDTFYLKKNSDNTVLYTSSTGTYNPIDIQVLVYSYVDPNTGQTFNYYATKTTQQVSATLTNQDGLNVPLAYDGTKPTDQQFSGTISDSSGVNLATWYTINNVPFVKFTDGFFESLP